MALKFLTRARGQLAKWLAPQNYGYIPITSADATKDALLFTGSNQMLDREVAASYATLFRCVNLISGTLADLIIKTVRVVDYEGNRLKYAAVAKPLALLKETPDGRITSLQFLQDITMDYLLDGNGLALVDRTSSGIAYKLSRLCSWSAHAQETESGWLYTAYFTDTQSGRYSQAHESSIIHTRWPHILKYGSRHGKGPLFAIPPLMVLRRALGTGIAADEYVNEYFDRATGGSRSKLAICFEDEPVDQTTREDTIKYVGEFTSQSRMPLVLFSGAKITKMGDTPQDADALKLREFQVREVARAYGVPAPLIGENVTQWGSGIEELSKLFYLFGAKYHLNGLLEALALALLPAGQKFAVEESEVYAGDTAALTALVKTAVEIGVITMAEARRRLGFPANLEGEVLKPPAYASGNSAPAG